jgi:hypothetical protein
MREQESSASLTETRRCFAISARMGSNRESNCDSSSGFHFKGVPSPHWFDKGTLMQIYGGDR